MFKFLTMVIIVLSLLGCAGSEQISRAPVQDINRAAAKYDGVHVVESGETLYSIAWRYNRDFIQLARANGIKSPYHVKAGQHLNLAANAKAPAKSARKTSQKAARKTVAKSSPQSQQVAQNTATTHVVPDVGRKLSWHWPTTGKIIQYFSTQNEQKGIDLAGKKGQPILAAAPGEVVYSGDGLRGYGRLIIIKHNDEFLSAYAHNSRLWVAEGTFVQASQKIAEMGQSDSTKPMLHFEIRRHGNPVDPLQFLPKQG